MEACDWLSDFKVPFPTQLSTQYLSKCTAAYDSSSTSTQRLAWIQLPKAFTKTELRASDPGTLEASQYLHSNQWQNLAIPTVRKVCCR